MTTSGPRSSGGLSPIRSRLEELHRRYRSFHEGEVATYIPELAGANPDWFAICVATTDGYVYEVGDFAQPFTIQSISKPFVYGLALEDNGRDALVRRGERLVTAGDKAGSLILLVRGLVSAWIPVPGGRDRRLATFTAGAMVGEVAFAEESLRSATVIADKLRKANHDLGVYDHVSTGRS